MATTSLSDEVNIACYSYKPIDGSLIGASTVIPRSGGFMEVRCGEKTRWAPQEARRMWETLNEWKTILPADAVVVETTQAEAKAKAKEKAKTRKPARIKISMSDSWSDDFRTAIGILEGHVRTAEICVETNRTVADALLFRIEVFKLSREVYAIRLNRPDLSYPENFSMIERYTTDIKLLLDQVRATLVEEPFEHRTCRKYKTSAKSHVIKAQRLSDGVFIPIFFDLSSGLMHSPGGMGEEVGVFGNTFAALGVRPVFLVPIGKCEQRLVSLEKTARSE